MKINQLLILTVLAFLSLQCKKEGVEPKDILVSKEWKKTVADKNLYSNPSGKILYASVLNCQKDDTYRFNENGKLTLKKGSSQCEMIEAASEDLPYSYNKASKELIISGIKYTLAEATSVQIKYYAPLPADSGSDYIVFLLE